VKQQDSNKDKTISASEINRYLYCNYQWYYQRKFGAAELARRKKAHLESLGITPASLASKDDGHLGRGRRFHADFGRRLRLKRLLRVLVVLAAAALAALLILLQTGVISW